MEDWERDFEWLKVRHFVKEKLKKEALPDLNIVLLLIGVQESGVVKSAYTKEEKQDLMHVAVCELLLKEGYYEFLGRDEDGWPHYKNIRPFEITGEKAQEVFLIDCVISYFSAIIDN